MNIRNLVLAATLLAPIGMSVAHADYKKDDKVYTEKQKAAWRLEHEKKGDKDQKRAEKRAQRAEKREHHAPVKVACK
jgi:hypothetical protein